MINLSHRSQQGATTLIIATILLMTATLIVLSSASYTVLKTKVAANQLRTQQAFMAAEAGLEFGINYLQQNRTTILANPVNGFIPNYTNASTTNVTLANNSRFSIVYTNPTANNYNLIRISSTGTSADGSATRVLSQRVQLGGGFNNPTTNSIVVNGSMAMSGNASIVNTTTNNTIKAASTVSITGNAGTTVNGTGSTPSNIRSDIQQNSSDLAGLTSSGFLQTYFGSETGSSFANTYTSSSNTTYNTQLNGLKNTTIWINQTGGEAKLSGNTVIGTEAEPVILVVNGSLDISGNVKIYGFVFVLGASTFTSDLTGNVSIVGGMAVGSNFSASGNTTVTYNSSVINAVKNLPGLASFAKVPGSWRDF